MNSFKNIVGNEFIIKFLKNAIKIQKISHAYVISGYEGCGKTLIANTFAKTILCENNIDNNIDACGICKSCISFENKNNPDVFYIHSKNKSKTIGVNDIRKQVLENVSIKPYEYDYKIFIIENADNMTVEAQNAFLKTLEEPPQYAIFLLLAQNTSKFLETILSRCVNIKIPPLSVNNIKNYIINNENISPENAQLFAEYSEGSIGKALTVANSDTFINMRNNILKNIIGLYKRDDFYIFEAVNSIEQYKNEKNIIDIIYLWYRDLLIMKIFKNEKYIIQKDKKEILLDESFKYSIENIIKKCEACISAKKELIKNSNFRLCMEVLFMKLKE